LDWYRRKRKGKREEKKNKCLRGGRVYESGYKRQGFKYGESGERKRDTAERELDKRGRGKESRERKE